MASAVAFAPSFAFVLGGGRYFDRLRGNARVQAFLTGAGPAAIGAIAGAAVPLGLSLTQPWQAAVLALAAIWLIALRRGVVTAIVALRRPGRDRLPGGRPGDVTTDGAFISPPSCVMIMSGSSGFPRQKSVVGRRCGRAVEA